MANQTITTNTNFDSLTGLLIGEQTTINSGATLTINSDPQLNRVLPGNIVINEGTWLIDGRTVREISFSGASTLPVIGDTLTAGSVTGQVIGVLGTTTSGSVRLRSLNGSIANGTALSFTGGKTATAASADRVGWLHVLMANNRTVSSNRQGVWQIESLWYELGTSTGATGQTFQHYCNNYVPAVWVETGSGTNTYEIWINAGGSFASIATDLDRGKFFSGTGQTLTFGNGTNGAVPPSGARIRVPNVHIGSAATGTPTTPDVGSMVGVNPTPNQSPGSTSRFRTLNFSGELRINRALFGSIHLAILSATVVSMEQVGIMEQLAIQRISSELTLEGIGIGLHPTSVDGTNSRISGLILTDVKIPASLTNLFCASYAQASIPLLRAIPAYIANCPQLGLNNSTFTVLVDAPQQVPAHGALFLDQCSGTVNNATVIGCPLTTQGCTELVVVDTRFSFTARVATTSANKPNSGAIICYLSKGVRFDGVRFINNGTIPAHTLLWIVQSSEIKIRNIGTFASPLNFANTGRNVLTVAGCDDIEIARCYVSNTISGFAFLATNNSNSKISILNCASDYADPILGSTSDLGLVNLLPNNSRISGFGSGNATFSSGIPINSRSAGMHFYDLFSSATTGQIGIFFTEKTSETISNATYTTSGTPIFTGIGVLQMRTTGDQIIYTDAYYRLGHTGFANTEFSFNGTNQANHTFEYDLDKGLGFSNTYKTVSAANLTAETGISETTGFRLRIRITCVTSNASNEIAGFFIPTTTTSTAQQTLYPLDLVTATLTLTGLITDSEVRIFRQSDSFELAGIENCLSTFSYTYVHSGSDIPVRIVIIKEGYVFIDIATTLTASSNAIPIQQRVDYSYA